MWAVISPYVIKFGFSLAIAILEKTGVLKTWQADGIKAGTYVLQTIESVKTYSTNDQLDPAKSDFPAQIHHNGV